MFFPPLKTVSLSDINEWESISFNHFGWKRINYFEIDIYLVLLIAIVTFKYNTRLSFQADYQSSFFIFYFILSYFILYYYHFAF